eukprot:4123163-Pyramimonas_sp.AAC.1
MPVLQRPAAVAAQPAGDGIEPRAAQVAADGGKATFDASQYTRKVQSYVSREEGLEDLGRRQHCKSHAARI